MWWTAGALVEIRACPFRWLPTSAWNRWGDEMEKTEEKRWITFSRTFLPLTCYILTCVFITVAKICTGTSKHKEHGSPVAPQQELSWSYHSPTSQLHALQLLKGHLLFLSGFPFFNRCPTFENHRPDLVMCGVTQTWTQMWTMTQPQTCSLWIRTVFPGF